MAQKKCVHHDFFQLLTYGGDACAPKYHTVCKKCRYNKGLNKYVPEDIWNIFAIPQLKKLREQKP